ncbi:hypothetical protein GUITHDRAFT_161837 [Guillardia theta CCMP2712]|uniref:WW domain-containing protein n=2 Tax=Guillardia theta TaxID=55529 RepID=L1JR86_GUITC|nr:hypothetical protein GUITHDRAFT_161837 [Guillardia theta CCMP2712]EKX50608.1 hypothetical protein GUITHDRAFT_161837 [Guillardia theta CCMP2712]|eukprot:XP_005837588.1 hypothetical protein GUITHDRAFT_161837 [Guillardia theta CCMP2712]
MTMMSTCCLLLLLLSMQDPQGASTLAGGFTMYGMQRSEADIGGADENDAMRTLQAASGGNTRLLSADAMLSSQERWLRPYFDRKAMGYSGKSQSRVEMLHQSEEHDAFSPQEPWDHLSDFKNQFYVNYEGTAEDTPDQFAPEEPWSNLPEHAQLEFQYADMKQSCLSGGDKFSWDADSHSCMKEGKPIPSLTWGSRDGDSESQATEGPFNYKMVIPAGEVDQYGWRTPTPHMRDNTLDYQTKDLERECYDKMKDVKHGGKFYQWDAVKHACVNVLGEEGEVDQYGWRAKANPPASKSNSLDQLSFVRSDVEHLCHLRIQQDARKGISEFKWDGEKRRCVSLLHSSGRADQRGWRARRKRSKKLPAYPLEWNYVDLKADCLSRGPEYQWKAHMSRHGECVRWGNKIRTHLKALAHGPFDFVKSDLRVECERRGRVWNEEEKACYRKLSAASSGIVDQYGWRKRKVEKPRQPQEPTGFPLHQTLQQFQLADYVAECKRLNGFIKQLQDPDRLECVSEEDCMVTDDKGTRFDCKAANIETFGDLLIARGSSLPIDQFNPGGSEAPHAYTPPLKVDASVQRQQGEGVTPLPNANADLHGKDVGTFVDRAPRGSFWTSGSNTANGSPATFFFNHETNEIRWLKPQLPPRCTRETNGLGKVPGCDWKKEIDLSSGEQFWKNRETGQKTWQDPFKKDKEEGEQRIPEPSKLGTWSGQRGGNPFWSPEFTKAKLGAHTSVLNLKAKKQSSCGGASGDCMDETDLVKERDAFNPDTAPVIVRGNKGSFWDSGEEKSQEKKEMKGRQQELAMIYGVTIPDSDARRFFGQDFSSSYKQPSKQEVDELVKKYAREWESSHPPMNATQEAQEEEKEKEEKKEEKKDSSSEEEVKWPTMPVYGRKYRKRGRTQWCEWEGSGGQMVPCQLGADGAWYSDPVSTGIWRQLRPNHETLVGNGVWRFPDSRPPEARQPS